MPLTEFLHNSEFDRETKRVMGVAFEKACKTLQLDDQGSLAERIAQTIIERAKGGETQFRSFA